MPSFLQVQDRESCSNAASVFAICVDRFAPDVAHKTLFTARLVPEDLWYALAYINGGGLNLLGNTGVQVSAFPVTFSPLVYL